MRCLGLYGKQDLVPFICLCCKTSGVKTATDYRKHDNHFCNKFCAAKFNGVKATKARVANNLRRNPPTERFCKRCAASMGVQPHAIKRVVCDDCWRPRGMLMTKKEVFTAYGTYKGHSKIRGLARSIFDQSALPKACIICGYSKHVQISHKKPVASYPDDAIVQDINRLENLQPLCPTHHWETDHGMLDIVT